MPTAGIVAEYNPFHNGHAHHIAKTREAGATHIVSVTSGHFTQRGEPATMPKRPRCEAALSGGADLIVELPLPWACASAETFAFGAVFILNALGCVDLLSFGSESGNIESIQKAAEMLTQADGSKELAQALKTGASFPRARSRAVEQLFPQAETGLLKNPNDTLAIEYLKTLLKLRSPIKPFAVKRSGARHDAHRPEEGFASASHIRSLMAEGRFSEALAFIPEEARPVYLAACRQGLTPFAMSAAEISILSQLRRMTAEEFAGLPDVAEGLENRIFKAASVSGSYEELLNRIKTKRFTLARIRRIIMAAWLGLSSDYTGNPPPYIRVLGFNNRGSEILAAAKKSATLPIVTRHSHIPDLGGEAARVYALECRAADLYGLCLPTRQPCGKEQRYKPVTLLENVILPE